MTSSARAAPAVSIMAVFGLTVIRHGETRYNKEKIMQGQGVDEPLSDTGFRQANAAGMYLRHVRFTHVFTSDLLRAKQTTASILRHSQHCKEIPVKCDPRLRERNYGVAEGRPLGDLKAMAKEAGEPYITFTPPGGESLDEVKSRVKSFFEDICHLVALEACPARAEFNAGTAEGTPSSSSANRRGVPAREANSEEAAGGLAANVLVVSHGAYMRNWVGYLVSELRCTLPAGLTKAELSSLTPNTGMSRFLVTLEKREDGLQPEIDCLFLNRSDHLHALSDS